MILKDVHRNKIDPLLHQALISAEGDDPIRIVALLSDDNVSISRPDNAEKPHPPKFLSRSDYRAALIEKRKRELANKHNRTIAYLKKLSVFIGGGNISNVVVLEGTAKSILSSLELPGISHASLDQPIELRESRR